MQTFGYDNNNSLKHSFLSDFFFRLTFTNNNNASLLLLSVQKKNLDRQLCIAPEEIVWVWATIHGFFTFHYSILCIYTFFTIATKRFFKLKLYRSGIIKEITWENYVESLQFRLNGKLLSADMNWFWIKNFTAKKVLFLLAVKVETD
jgi:hypothetical protein